MKTNKKAVKPSSKSHVVYRGNQKVIRATRESIGAMKYKAQ